MIARLARGALLAGLLLLGAGQRLDAQAQEPAADPAPPAAGVAGETSFIVANVTRGELWRFFEPPESGGQEPDYAFVGSRSTLGVRYTGARWAFQGAIQYVRIENLPRGAIGPGLLGTGGAYFFQAADTFSYQYYLRGLSLRLRDVAPGVSVEAGRMSFAAAVEAPSGHDAVDRLARERLSGRLLGDMEWSLYQRAWDGVRVDVDRGGWRATAAAVLPTQGTFEESANLPLDRLKVATAQITLQPGSAVPRTQLQGFVHVYDDRREVHARPDNSGAEASEADVQIATIGTSALGVFPRGAGQWDALVWLAAQAGDWYGQPHRAASGALEAGFQWTTARGRPWLRAGGLYASGDGDGLDASHGTFFPMLPSGDRYSASNTYALMNLVDLWTEARLAPHSRLELGLAIHRLTLASSADRWYFGSGATERRGNYFGFLGRSAHGSSSLGTVVEGSLAWRITPWWSVRAYAGRFAGGDTVRRAFRGDRLLNGWLESSVGF